MAAVAAFLTSLGGLDLSGIISLLPESVAQAFAIAFPSLAGVVHLLTRYRRVLDPMETPVGAP